eukprot:g29123.t1
MIFCPGQETLERLDEKLLQLPPLQLPLQSPPGHLEEQIQTRLPLKNTLNFQDMQLERRDDTAWRGWKVISCVQVIGTKGQQIAEIRQKSGAQAGD